MTELFSTNACHDSHTMANLPSNQSGYEPLNLENRSFLNSDNFDATNLRFYPKVKLKLKPTGIVKK